MSDLKIQLKGGQAIAAILIFAGIIVLRLITLNDMTDDDYLMKHLNRLLMDEYSPHVAEQMRTAVETGDDSTIQNAANSVTSTKINIVSVKASYPIFKFSLPKDVVIKVVFSLEDSAQSGESRTMYYLFKRGVFGWQYQYITSSLSYYLNFT